MNIRRFAPALLVVCLLAAPAFAQEALRLSPTTFTPADEAFLTIFVSGLSETDLIQVTFDGPGGTATVEPSAIGSSSIIVWVPELAMNNEGRYQVDVYVTRETGVLHYGPGYIDVEIPDGEPPSFGLDLPEVVVGQATSLEGGILDYVVGSTDGTPVDCTPPSGSLFAFGPTTVNCTATNSLGQTATGSFLAFMLDGIAPVVVVPDDIVTDNAVVTYTVTATDNIDPSPDVFCSPASGATFPGGTTRVRCTAIDLHANYGYGEFNVTVIGGAPIITVPDDLYVEATSNAGAVVTYSVSATEAGVIACTPPSGSTFGFGTTTVNCTATNSVGSTSGSFTITVDDRTAPTLNLSDITAEATSADGAQVTFATTASDTVDVTVPMTCTPASGSTFALGDTLVQCSATDAHGNEATGSFTVSVVDTTPPVIVSISATPNTLWPPDHKMVAVTLSVVAVDAVDPAPITQIISVSSNQPANGTGDGDVAPDWEITGPLTLNLRAERAGTADRIYTITVQSTDSAGNTATATVQVKVTQSRRRAV